jgi:hypothetical protein
MFDEKTRVKNLVTLSLYGGDPVGLLCIVYNTEATTIAKLAKPSYNFFKM